MTSFLQISPLTLCRSVLVCFALLLAGLSAQAQTIRYVKPNGSGTGTSWADASGSLQSMINASSTNDQVWVAAGIYKPTSTTDRTVSFAMKNGVTIFGGFPNITNPTVADRYPGCFLTILSGDIDNSGTPTNNSYHVIVNVGLDNTAVLDGFVITGGNADSYGNPFPNQVGGGVYNKGTVSAPCNPTFRNCTFQDNEAQYGGAMYNGGYTETGRCSPTLINCLFQRNNGSRVGGALYNDGVSSGVSSPTITNCSFQNNTAYGGGAIYNNGAGGGTCSPLFRNCSFLTNSAPFTAPDNGSGGGAIENGGGSPTLINCVLFGNGGSNTFYNYQGGGLTTVSYSLLDTQTAYTTGPGNLTTVTSPFASGAGTMLAPGSMAIDAGDNTTTNATVGNTDLAGNPRIVNSRVDMGAYEFQTAPPPILLSITTQPGAGSVVCLGELATAMISTSGTVTGYQWYRGTTPVMSQTTATLSLSNIQTTDAGSYSVVVTGACVSVTSTAFSLTVNTPNATIAATPSAVLSCAQNAATLSVNQPGGTFRWSTGATTASISLSVAGPYSVTTTVGSCSATGNITLSGSGQGTPPSPLFVVSGPCSATGLTLTALGGNSYSFSGPGIISQFDGSYHTSINGYLINQTPLPATGTALINQPGTYIVLVTGDGGCTATATLTVTSLACPGGGR